MCFNEFFRLHHHHHYHPHQHHHIRLKAMPIHLEIVVERELSRRTKLYCIDVWWNLVAIRRNVDLRSRVYLRYNARLVQLAVWCWMWEFDSVRKGRLRSA